MNRRRKVIVALAAALALLASLALWTVVADSQTPAPTADVWTFGPPRDGTSRYADGTVVPSRGWTVFLNGAAVGEVDVHMHRRRGPDGKLDASFGFTGVIYGPPPGGR